MVEKLKKDVAKQNASVGVLVTETMPVDKEKPHLVDGIWVCHFSDFVTLKILRHGLVNIAKSEMQNWLELTEPRLCLIT